MSAAPDHLARGIAAHQSGRIEEALAAYRAALEASPEDAEAMSLYGLALTHAGRAKEAEPFLQGAVDREPGQTGFRVNLGQWRQAIGDHAGARDIYADAASRDPGNPNPWEMLGDAHVSLGDIAAAEKAYAHACGLAPAAIAPRLKRARALGALGQLDDAWDHVQLAAQQAPAHEGVQRLQAELLIRRRDWAALDAVSTAWAQARPDNATAWRNLSIAAFEQGYLQRAADAFAEVLAREGRSANNLAAYGGLRLHSLEYESAQQALDEAEKLDPGHADMLVSKTLLHMYFGRFPEAEQCARRALARDPTQGSAYTYLSRLLRGNLPDADVNAAAMLAERADVGGERRIPAAFAVANALDARGDTDRAFAAYERARALTLARAAADGLRYDAARAEQDVARIAALSDGIQGVAQTSGPVPIFIVGMPRSGTTLIESVLSAHSKVAGCGELPMMQQILRAFIASGGARDGDLGDWAALYRSTLPASVFADFTTDKHPLNYEAIGLILHLFPDAVIVHARRDPMETGFSIWRQEFSKFMTFSERLEDIGHMYGCYARLMAHWEHRFPGRIVHVQYEPFVQDFARAAPALVAACGLQWEDGCGRFQNAPRPISTFSAVQAREPVSLRNGRVARYRKYLKPLEDALTAAGVDLQTGALR